MTGSRDLPPGSGAGAFAGQSELHGRVRSLASRYPMLLTWGPAFTQIYDDACSKRIGDKARARGGRPGGYAPAAAPGGPLVASCDWPRMEQVPGNLLHNAVKYGAGQPVEVRVEAAGGAALLSVVDHGIVRHPGRGRDVHC